MGGEFAQFSEWAYQRGLDWMLLDYPAHRQMQTYVKALNHFYLATPQLWEQDTDWRGFEWISHDDNRNNTIAFRRIAKDGSDIVVVVNFSPEHLTGYRIGVPFAGTWEEVFSSDRTEFGGSGIANGKVKTDSKKPLHGQDQSISIDIPRFGVLFFKGKPRAKRRTKAEIEAAKKAAAEKKAKSAKSAKSGSKAVAKAGEKAVAKTGTPRRSQVRGKGSDTRSRVSGCQSHGEGRRKIHGKGGGSHRNKGGDCNRRREGITRGHARSVNNKCLHCKGESSSCIGKKNAWQCCSQAARAAASTC